MLVLSFFRCDVNAYLHNEYVFHIRHFLHKWMSTKPHPIREKSLALSRLMCHYKRGPCLWSAGSRFSTSFVCLALGSDEVTRNWKSRRLNAFWVLSNSEKLTSNGDCYSNIITLEKIISCTIVLLTEVSKSVSLLHEIVSPSNCMLDPLVAKWSLRERERERIPPTPFHLREYIKGQIQFLCHSICYRSFIVTGASLYLERIFNIYYCYFLDI